MILAHPDWSLEFEIHKLIVTLVFKALVLHYVRRQLRGKKVIHYAGKSLNDAQRKYAAHELEAMAVDWAVTTFRSYVHGSHFTVHTDNHALKWLMTREFASDRVMRYAMRLQCHSFTIIHKPGELMADADGLSRLLRLSLHCSPSYCDAAELDTQVQRTFLKQSSQERATEDFSTVTVPFPEVGRIADAIYVC